MFAFHLWNRSKGEQVTEAFPQQSVAEVVSTSNQVSHLYRHRRSFRLVFLMVLTLIGFYLLAGSGITSAGTHAHTRASKVTISTPAPFGHPQQANTLSGAGEGLPRAPTVPAFCAPFDVNCWLGQAAQWIAQNIFNVLQPLIDAINQSSLNFITQTPPAGTYQNATVMQFTAWSTSVVDAAVAGVGMFAGYSNRMARKIGDE